MVTSLSWEEPLARELVHRRSAEEVLITGMERAGDSRFLCAARWRRGHRTFNPGNGGLHSPLMVAETIRQACICLSTAFLGIPRDSNFVIKALGFDIDPDHAPRAHRDSTDVLVDVEVGGLHRDPGSGRVAALTMDARYSEADRCFAAATGKARIFTPPEYAELRRSPASADSTDAADPTGTGRPPERPAAERPAADRVGVARAEDVLIARTSEGSWVVDPADPRHPFFFDHEVDHLPGMLLLEAARQYALIRDGLPGRYLAAMRMRPFRFAERRPSACFRGGGGDTGTGAADAAALRSFELLQGDQVVLELGLGFSDQVAGTATR